MIILPLKRFKIKIGNILLSKYWKFLKLEKLTIKKSQDFLLDTVENVTIAKKSYESFYKITEQSFYLTMQKLSFEEYNAIKDDFYRENCFLF